MKKVTHDSENAGQHSSCRLARKMSLEVTKTLDALRLNICLICFRPNQKEDLNGQTLCHVL